MPARVIAPCVTPTQASAVVLKDGALRSTPEALIICPVIWPWVLGSGKSAKPWVCRQCANARNSCLDAPETFAKAIARVEVAPAGLPTSSRICRSRPKSCSRRRRSRPSPTGARRCATNSSSRRAPSPIIHQRPGRRDPRRPFHDNDKHRRREWPPLAIRSPRPGNPSPGISSCSPRTISAASAAWAKACRSRSPRTAAASSGWRTRARRRISPASTSPIRAIPRWWCRPSCRRLHALEFARMLRQQHHGGGLSDAEDRPAAGRNGAVRRLGAGKAALDLVLRLLGRDLARRASIVVLRRRIRAHGFGRARLQAEQPARRPVLPLHRRARSVQAEGNRPLVDARHVGDRQHRAAAAPPARQRLSRAQHQRLSSRGRTGFTSATSTAACS